MITTPIFLVGAERSGTTLLRLMLDYHPQIAFHHEFELVVEQLSEDSTAWPELNDYYEYLSTHRIFLHANFNINQTLSYPELVNDFLLQKQQRSGHKPVIGATVHHQFHLLTRIWPQAKFIHLLRDGRDVARSMIVMGWAGNMFSGVEEWIKAETIWERFSRQLTPDQQLSVKYEDLILNSDQVLTQICQFIGVPFDKAMYDYANHSTYHLPEPSLVSQWRKKLSAHEIQLAESQIAPMLEARGYPLGGLPLLTITKILRWRMGIQNRWAKMRFRWQRYPTKLYLADVLSRRFGTKRWRKRVQIRINEHDNQFMK